MKTRDLSDLISESRKSYYLHRALQFQWECERSEDFDPDGDGGGPRRRTTQGVIRYLGPDFRRYRR